MRIRPDVIIMMLSLDRGFSFRYLPTILIRSDWCVKLEMFHDPSLSVQIAINTPMTVNSTRRIQEIH
jgi:hypothetical protein